MKRLSCLAVVLLAGAQAAAAPPGFAIPDGTLLCLENCSSVVERATRGQIGHVALLLGDGGEQYVYEATPAQVRRVTLDEYVAELARLNGRRNEDDKLRAWLLRPESDYTPDETARMRTYLDAQLGRRYSVKNYVRGQPYDGIHCAELASSTLNESGRHAFEDCHKIHPQALYAAALATHAPPEQLTIPPPVVEESWCIRAQRRWAAWSTWCRWSCREAWAWCW
jgi:hypothetical protein